ncbi:hypothetical protein ACWEO4_32000 [Streptomyces sp. NPDC004393]|uniref:hypothetical protein n=1 Tax=Streptomyces sp. NPDC004533 TaxID=3154278 RepID=UPI0033A5E6EA
MAHDTEAPGGLASIAALLPLPEHNSLSEEQVRGAECVWGCGKTLTAETAVELPERRIRNLDTYIDTFPRGCRPCTGRRALKALYNHCPVCEQCVDNVAECEIGRTLRRFTRGAFL